MEHKTQITLTEDDIDGIADLKIGDKVTIHSVLQVKGLRKTKHYGDDPMSVNGQSEKKEPSLILEAEFEILKVELMDSKIKEEIDETENVRELDEVAKKIPKEEK